MLRHKIGLGALLLSLSATPALGGCAAIAGSLPTVISLVSNVLSVLAGIDAVVNEQFRRHPDIPQNVRQTYVALYERTQSSLRALQLAAEGGKSLDDKDVASAFAKFEAAYNELKGWLLKQELSNDAGQLLLDGSVVGEVPPAASFK